MDHKPEIEQYLAACKCNEEVKAIVLKIDNYMSDPDKTFEFGLANSKKSRPRNIYYALFSKKKKKNLHRVSLIPQKKGVYVKIKIGGHIIKDGMPDLIETLKIEDVSYQYNEPKIGFHLYNRSQLNDFYTLMDFVYKHFTSKKEGLGIGTSKELTQKEIALEKIQKLDKKYSGKPEFEEVVVKQIKRPSDLRDAILEARGAKCQICGYEGFREKNGSIYAETHHVIELNKLAPKTLQSWNILVLCPLCHRKMHYADVKSEFLGDGWKIIIDGEELIVR